MRKPHAPTRRAATVLAALFAAHCGGAQTPATEPVAPPPTPTAAADAGPARAADAAAPSSAAGASAWTGLTAGDLQRIVSEGARARLAQLAPQFDAARLADYAEHPERAPELSGRAVERLLDLATVELAAGRGEAAERIVRVARARAVNRNSAFVANTTLAEARRRAAGADPQAQERAIADVFRQLPLVRFNGATVFFQLFQRPEQLRARVATVQRAMVSMETASTVLFYTAVAPDIVANRERYLAAINTVRQEHAARPARAPYAFSTVNLAGARDARPVPVAVWDLGTNPALFQSQLYANPGEQPNGRDDDANNQADDIHGLASDPFTTPGTPAPNTALLYEPPAAVIDRYGPQLRGVMDLRAGLTSTPAAQRTLELMRAVENAEQQLELDRGLDAIGEWAHGTHVAGIMTAGVPQARLAIFRSAWAGESRPYEHRGPTDAEVEGEHANMRDIAAWINAQHIRVVNASLGFSLEYLEDALRHETGRYHSDEEVRARARSVHDRRRAFWQEVFTSCPQTLFVVAAGNSNQDVVEYEEVPASLQAPNLIAVGAVDRFGDWATFTNSNAERVRIFDHGVEVDSLIPSGGRVPLSGTSMASPNVANLAAKMFALDAGLTPGRASTIIVETGDAIAAPFNGRIANEARALARVRAERGRRPAAPAARAATPAARPAAPATPRPR